jgi:hypothetical protein
MASWGIETTAVELVPSVPDLFGYYHADGPEILRSPRVHVVVDDGRRFLEWTSDTFDVITIDPPPPVEAAGSSLLYSREFYRTAKTRLRPGGILQQWFPGSEPALDASVVRAIREEFPHVRIFSSILGWGFHILASDSPIDPAPASVLASRIPPRAASDLVEWIESANAQQVMEAVLAREIAPEALIQRAPELPAIRDDRPVNEYFFLRRSMTSSNASGASRVKAGGARP